MERLREHNVFAEKLHGGPWQRAGMPDILAVMNGCALFIEVKVPGNRATPIQEHVMKEIRASGGWAGVMYGPDDLNHLLSFGPYEVCRTHYTISCDDCGG